MSERTVEGLREVIGNAIYDSQTPGDLQSPSAYQADVPKLARAICEYLGITEEVIKACGAASVVATSTEIARAADALLLLREVGDV